MPNPEVNAEWAAMNTATNEALDEVIQPVSLPNRLIWHSEFRLVVVAAGEKWQHRRIAQRNENAVAACY